MLTPCKLAIFADESGTVALDGFFLVAVVIVPQAGVAELTSAFLALEQASDRRGRKWLKTNDVRKVRFLNGLESILASVEPVHWRAQPRTGDLVALTAAAVADAARARDSEAVFRVQIDGFNAAECNVARRAFSERSLRYKRLVGGTEESAPLLRLADSFAGFLADVHKAKPYAGEHWQRLHKYFAAL